MKTITRVSTIVLLTALLAACTLWGTGGSSTEGPGSPSEGTSTGAESEDQVYSVEFIVSAGVLQGHSRHETEYNDLAAGPASLSNGSFLRTLAGEAFVLLPGDSILKMGPETEVQVGLYENGIMIWQHSGSTLNIVVPQEGATYEVDTPFGVAQAHGTEYEVRVDYPAAGWVAVYWGEIGVVETVPAVVYGLVPEGVLFIGPGGQRESFLLEPGDTITWDIDPATGQPRHSPNTTPPDAAAQSNQQIARNIRALMDLFQDGSITREEYHSALNDLLNEALGLIEPGGGEEEEPPLVLNLGGLYGGMTEGGQAVTLCYDGSAVTRITWSTELQCSDKVTGEPHTRWYIFTIGLDAIMMVDPDGYFSIIYPYDPTLSDNTGIFVEGMIGSGGGRVLLSAQSDSDVEFCATGDVTIPLNPTGTTCSGE